MALQVRKEKNMSKPLIYTSYFANIRNLPDTCIPISIAQFTPQGFIFAGGLEYKTLAPPVDMLKRVKKDHDHAKYTVDYTHDVLGKLDKQQVQQEILDMSNGKIPILVCYEKPDNFCHRKIVAEWLGITEWSNETCTTEIEEALF